MEHFVNTTVAMERVTENYLEGEQSICNNWAHYINSSDMTLEEAAAYVRATHAQTTVSGCLMNCLVYPEVVAALTASPEALKAGGDMDPAAGEYMRPGLEAMMELIGKGYINLEKCNEFMRFLVSRRELNEMASVKRMVTPTTDLSCR